MKKNANNVLNNFLIFDKLTESDAKYNCLVVLIFFIGQFGNTGICDTVLKTLNFFIRNKNFFINYKNLLRISN